MFSYVVKKCSCYISETAVTCWAEYLGEVRKQLIAIITVLQTTKIGQKYRKITKGCPNCVDTMVSAARSCLVRGSRVSKGRKHGKEKVLLVLLCHVEKRKEWLTANRMVETMCCSIKTPAGHK